MSDAERMAMSDTEYALAQDNDDLRARIAELEALIRDLPCVGCEAPGLECSNCRTRREAFE